MLALARNYGTIVDTWTPKANILTVFSGLGFVLAATPLTWQLEGDRRRSETKKCKKSIKMWESVCQDLGHVMR